MISIGNLAVGGRAKTPLAAFIARRLLAAGERPAILSRGYARRDRRDGVVVVRDPAGIRADLARAGDEPLMLARQLDGVAVLVSPSRYLAGRLAEHHFAATVHVLDDGFQHFELHRDADIVVLARRDIEDPRTLPAGRLREPLDAASAADAFVLLDGEVALDRLPLDGRPVWRARQRVGAVRWTTGDEARMPHPGARVLAFAGIADPGGFFREVRTGWTVVKEMQFRDHHAYSRRDVHDIMAAARGAGAAALLTTEKDLVRLLPFRPFASPVGYLPFAVEVEPLESFEAWLSDRLLAARG